MFFIFPNERLVIVDVMAGIVNFRRTIFHPEKFKGRLRAVERKVHPYKETNAFISEPKSTPLKDSETDSPSPKSGIENIPYLVVFEAKFL